jgi:putative DNA-invertase from lambdoid prophage Rac
MPVSEGAKGGALFVKLKAGDVVITPKFDRLFRSALDALRV